MGRRCWADPPPFRPAHPRGPLPQSPSPARGRARLAPPSAGHMAAVRRRRGRGRPADRHNPVGMPPRAPRPPPLCPLPTPSSSPLVRSNSRGGAPPCAIDAAAKLTTPTTRVRLNTPPAPLDELYPVRSLSAVRVKVLGEIPPPRHGQSSGELSVRVDLPFPALSLFGS